MILLLAGVAIAGWALGMFHASTICSKQGSSLMETYNEPSQWKNKGSDMILRNQAATAFGCAWAIKLWLKPWIWGRPWNDFRRKWVGLDRPSKSSGERGTDVSGKA